jgi:hypothetical protein
MMAKEEFLSASEKAVLSERLPAFKLVVAAFSKAKSIKWSMYTNEDAPRKEAERAAHRALAQYVEDHCPGDAQEALWRTSIQIALLTNDKYQSTDITPESWKAAIEKSYFCSNVVDRVRENQPRRVETRSPGKAYPEY